MKNKCWGLIGECCFCFCLVVPLGVDVILQEVIRDHIFQILRKSRLLSQNSKAEKVKKVSRSLLPIIAPQYG